MRFNRETHLRIIALSLLCLGALKAQTVFATEQPDTAVTPPHSPTAPFLLYLV